MNEYQRKQKEAVEIKRNYPTGTRIELNEMIDTYSPVKAGMRGTVRFVDSMGQIHIILEKWVKTARDLILTQEVMLLADLHLTIDKYYKIC